MNFNAGVQVQRVWIATGVLVLGLALAAWYTTGGIPAPEPAAPEPAAPESTKKKPTRTSTKLVTDTPEPAIAEGPLYTEENVRSLLEDHIGDRDIEYFLTCDPAPCIATLHYPNPNALSLASQRATGGLRALGDQTMLALEDAKSLQAAAPIGLHTTTPLVSMKRGQGTSVVLIAQHDPPSEELNARALGLR